MTRLNSTYYLDTVAWVPFLAQWVAFNYAGTSFFTSPDAITWTTRSFAPGAMSGTSLADIVITNNAIYLFSTASGGAGSSGGAALSGAVAMTLDGINWQFRYYSPQACNNLIAKVNPVRYAVNGSAYLEGSDVSINTVLTLRMNAANTLLEAPNLDGISTKRILLEASLNLMMISAETIANESLLNPVYQSDNRAYGQQLDLVNGGVLYIAVKNRYIAMLSFLPSGVVYGSATGNGPTIISEYSRDDGWNLGNGASPYPTHAWLNPSLTNFYAPRLKTSPTLDVVGANATLLFMIAAPFGKQILSADNVATPAAMEIRVSNFSTLTYGVLGGILLGGFKQTVTSFGNSGDELMVGPTHYFVAASGTTRMLIPKE